MGLIALLSLQPISNTAVVFVPSQFINVPIKGHIRIVQYQRNLLQGWVKGLVFPAGQCMPDNLFASTFLRHRTCLIQMIIKGADEEVESCFWLQGLARSKENPFLSWLADGKIQRMKQLQLLQKLGVEVDEVASGRNTETTKDKVMENSSVA